MINEKDKSVAKFTYVNYKNITNNRNINPIKLYYGNTEWYPENQWLLKAYDIEKKEIRVFAMKNIKCWL
jgi:predicted DNA-binding transcriptional regulator YafY